MTKRPRATRLKQALVVALSAIAASMAAAAAQPKPEEAGGHQNGYKSGLLAEIYVVSRVGKVKLVDLPTKPFGVPIGTIEESEVPVLRYSLFVQDEAIANYYGQNILGVLWSGFLDIREDGMHIVSISDYRETPWGVGEEGCVVSAWLNGNDALGLRHRSHGESKQHYTDQQAFELSPGLYELAIWKVCSNEAGEVLDPSTLDMSRLTLLMKTPSQRKVTPIDPERLIHEVR